MCRWRLPLVTATIENQTMNTVLITGNTYPVREEIKAMGGKWDSLNQGWQVPASKAVAARKLVSEAPQSSGGYGRAKGGTSRKCKTGGNCSS